MERFSYGTILERFCNEFVTLFLKFQCKMNFRYRYFEVKQNGKTVPFRFTFGTNNLEVIPKGLTQQGANDTDHSSHNIQQL
jgi:hypothetical protein